MRGRFGAHVQHRRLQHGGGDDHLFRAGGHLGERGAALRVELGGHIGYHVRPSARRQGVASAALREVVRRAAGIGLAEVLVTCDESNLASRRTAESAGGVLTRTRPVDDYGIGHDFLEPTCHYWISTAPNPPILVT